MLAIYSCLRYLTSRLYRSNISSTLIKRLELNSQKIDAIVAGIVDIARQKEPIGNVSTMIFNERFMNQMCIIDYIAN